VLPGCRVRGLAEQRGAGVPVVGIKMLSLFREMGDPF